jgi:hypothetical protein
MVRWIHRDIQEEFGTRGGWQNCSRGGWWACFIRKSRCKKTARKVAVYIRHQRLKQARLSTKNKKVARRGRNNRRSRHPRRCPPGRPLLSPWKTSTSPRASSASASACVPSPWPLAGLSVQKREGRLLCAESKKRETCLSFIKATFRHSLGPGTVRGIAPSRLGLSNDSDGIYSDCWWALFGTF